MGRICQRKLAQVDTNIFLGQTVFTNPLPHESPPSERQNLDQQASELERENLSLQTSIRDTQRQLDAECAKQLTDQPLAQLQEHLAELTDTQ